MSCYAGAIHTCRSQPVQRPKPLPAVRCARVRCLCCAQNRGLRRRRLRQLVHLCSRGENTLGEMRWVAGDLRVAQGSIRADSGEGVPKALAVSVCSINRFECFCDLFDLFRNLVLRHPADAQPDSQVFLDGHMGQNARGREAIAPSIGGVSKGRILATDRNRAVGQDFEPVINPVKVDLPQSEGPTKTTISAWPTSSSTPGITSSAPKSYCAAGHQFRDNADLMSRLS